MLLAMIEVDFHLISSLSVAAFYFFRVKIRCRRKILKNGMLIAATLCVTVIASYIDHLFVRKLFFYPVIAIDIVFFVHLLLPALVISLLITVTILFFEDLSEKNKILENETRELPVKDNDTLKADGLLVRHGDSQKYIRYSDIAYISSKKRVTIAHALCGDYMLYRPIGEVVKDV